jgi:hypothetical protein
LRFTDKTLSTVDEKKKEESIIITHFKKEISLKYTTIHLIQIKKTNNNINGQLIIGGFRKEKTKIFNSIKISSGLIFLKFILQWES